MFFNTNCRILAILWLASMISGCATSRSEQVAKEGLQSMLQEAKRLERPSVVTHSDLPYVAATRIDYVEPPKEGSIQLVASSVEIGKLLEPLATSLGYSVQFLLGTNPDQRVTLSHKNIAALSAVREIAFAAGYVAVIDERTRTVRIAESAQYTFRVPSHVTTPSAPSTRMTFTASSNMPANSTTGSAGGASAAAATGMGNATVTTSTDPSKGFKAYLQGLLGESAQINVIQEAGVVSVRGKGYQLLRARDFLERYVSEGMRQVNLEVSVVEVSLQNEFEFGVDWAKVVPLNRFNTGSAAIQIANANRVSDPAMTVGITTNSISSVVKALENRTSVRVLSAPRLMLTNNMPALYKKVTNRPYVPSVTSTTTGSSSLGGSVTASATAANIPEGTVLTAIGNVLDNGNVWISLLAQSVDVTGFQSFSPTKDTLLTVPIAPTTELPVSILAESGKTVVVAGQRSRRDSKTGSGVPFAQEIPFVRELLAGVKDVDSASEVFILVNATVLPAPKVDVQIAESI